MKAIRVVNIEDDLHTAFKIHCVGEGVSMSQRLIQLMQDDVEGEEDHRTIAAAFAKGIKKVSNK